MATGRAVVAGAGIGGLATAIGLARAGWDVTVLEQAGELGEVGAGLGLWSNALAALEWLDVAAPIRALGTMTDGGGLRTSEGRWLLRAPAPRPGEQLPVALLMVHRAHLYRELLDALPGHVEVRTGCQVVDVDPGAGAVTVSAADGMQTLAGDVVVGADGLRSRVRQAMWPDAPAPAYAGFTAWRAITDGVVPVTDNVQTWGRGESFGLSRLVDGRLYWYATAQVSAGTVFDDDRAEALRRFGGWHDPIGRTIEATPPEAVLRHDTYALPRPLPTFARDRAVLVGDAAHAMTPHLGQGACLAVEDAVALTALLATAGDVPSALERYDRERQPRTTRLSKQSESMGRPVEASGAVSTALRNALVRMVPRQLAIRSLARTARWEPPARVPG